jgi:hypothetical protein
VRMTISAQLTIPPIFSTRRCSVRDHKGIRFAVRTPEGDIAVKHRKGKVTADDLIRILRSCQQDDSLGAAIDKFEARLNHWAPAELTDIELSETAIECLRELVRIAEGERDLIQSLASILQVRAR